MWGGGCPEQLTRPNDFVQEQAGSSVFCVTDGIRQVLGTEENISTLPALVSKAGRNWHFPPPETVTTEAFISPSTDGAWIINQIRENTDGVAPITALHPRPTFRPRSKAKLLRHRRGFRGVPDPGV